MGRLTFKVVVAAVAGAALVSLSAACASSTRDRASDNAASDSATEQVLNFGVVASELSNVDPSVYSAGTILDPLVLDLLMKVSPTGQVEPNLAQSVTQPAPNVYVYELRRGVKFWDGTELTSADVANSINYQRDPAKGNALFTNVKSVEATDRYTVVVTLNHPDSSWPYVFAFAGFIWQKKFQDEHKTTFGQPGTLIMGSGPYKIDSLDPTSGATLTANSNYWGGKPAFERVVLKLFANETSQALAFRAGDIDVAFPFDSRAFASTSGAKLTSVLSCTWNFFSMNTQVPPWNDVHVRRAVAYAIDRSAIIEAVGGFAIPGDTLIPSSSLQTIAPQSQVDTLLESLPTYPFSVDRAEQELAESAYPTGFSATLETFDYGNFVVLGQAIAGQLAKIGIKLDVKVVSATQYAEDSGKSAPEEKLPLTISFQPCNNSDPGLNPQYYLGDKNASQPYVNYAAYVNPAANELIEIGATKNDPATRFTAYSELLGILAQDVPYVTLYLANNNVALSSTISWPTFNGYSSQWFRWVQDVRPRESE